MPVERAIVRAVKGVVDRAVVRSVMGKVSGKRKPAYRAFPYVVPRLALFPNGQPRQASQVRSPARSRRGSIPLTPAAFRIGSTNSAGPIWTGEPCSHPGRFGADQSERQGRCAMSANKGGGLLGGIAGFPSPANSATGRRPCPAPRHGALSCASCRTAVAGGKSAPD